jgi:hypothetical protein
MTSEGFGWTIAQRTLIASILHRWLRFGYAPFGLDPSIDLLLLQRLDAVNRKSFFAVSVPKTS